MKRSDDDPQGNPDDGLLAADDDARTRYFETSLAALVRLWTRTSDTDGTPPSNGEPSP